MKRSDGIRNFAPGPRARQALLRQFSRVEVDGQQREVPFLTNNMEWSAQSVVDLYRCCWAIELFLKVIKQTLKPADFRAVPRQIRLRTRRRPWSSRRQPSNHPPAPVFHLAERPSVAILREAEPQDPSGCPFLDVSSGHALLLSQMSATELIEQLKALSAKERDAFARLFRELEKPTVSAAGNGNGNGASAPGSGNWPDFGARLKRIYGNKVVADSEAVISYARGDW